MLHSGLSFMNSMVSFTWYNYFGYEDQSSLSSLSFLRMYVNSACILTRCTISL
jgi:hypothetical protein